MTAELMITKEKGKNWAFQFCCDHDSESVLRRALHTHMRNRWEYRVCVWVGQELLARAIIRAIIRSVIYTHIYASIYNRLLMKWVSPPYSLQTSRRRGSCPEAVPKGPYSNSRYSTGTNFQLKPMQVGRSFSNATGIHLLFNDISSYEPRLQASPRPIPRIQIWFILRVLVHKITYQPPRGRWAQSKY